MEAAQLLSLLPDSILEGLALDTQVNKYTKKLYGETVFKLLIHCILSFKDNSLRTMESAYESVIFKLLHSNIKSDTISFSSISERLSVINPVFFEKLYTKCVETYSAVLTPAKTELIRFDSTIISLSGKLLNVGKKELIRHNNLPELVIETTTLHIYSDSWVYLYKTHGVKADHPVRCIEALIKATGEMLVFITNIESDLLSAADVTILYKYRWDIEVFFKFIKQELNFSHLINRSENGIKVMLYCTMITAILLLAYKEINGLKGFKIMKQQFVNDLEVSLMKDMIVMCGGNPDKLNTILKSAPK